MRTNDQVRGALFVSLMISAVALGASQCSSSDSATTGPASSSGNGSGSDAGGGAGATGTTGAKDAASPGDGSASTSQPGATPSDAGATAQDAAGTPAPDAGTTAHDAGATSSGDGSTGRDAASPDSGSSGSTQDAGAPAGQAFSSCRFHFGAIDSTATSGGTGLITQLDAFTSGWLGQNDVAPDGVTKAICKEANAGGALAAQTPALVSYVIAYAGRHHACLSDCNATNAVGQNGCTAATSSDLCTGGAAYIRSNFTTILGIYQSYAEALAGCYGTTRPLIWEMEPDYYQYHAAAQNGSPLTVAEAADYMTQIMTTVRKAMPNALFSLDISPWMPTNGSTWYPSFDLSMVSFISTSGGNTNAGSTLIRTNNAMTWAGVHAVTGKPILADTGYGVAGASSGPDPAWDNPANINARIADGVISITQYNPTASTWGATISGDRSQLNPVPCY